MIKITKGKYTAFSAKSAITGMGSAYIYKDNKLITHATTKGAFTEEELQRYLDTIIVKEEENDNN